MSPVLALVREGFFGFPSARPFVSGEAKITLFFGRVIIYHFWSSTAPALRFLAVSRSFLFVLCSVK